MNGINWRRGDERLQPERLPTVDFQCFHCHKTTRVPQRSVADAEAKHWRKRYETLIASLNDMLERCNKEHGDDAVRRWMLRDLINLRKKYETEGWET